MKLRIRNNSIRLRLTKPEVKRLCETHQVEAQTRLGPLPQQILTYRVEATHSVKELHAEFKDSLISVKIPMDAAIHWATSDLITLHNHQSVSPSEQLSILIEKDFFCLKERRIHPATDNFELPTEQEDDTHFYSNPNELTGRCS